MSRREAPLPEPTGRGGWLVGLALGCALTGSALNRNELILLAALGLGLALWAWVRALFNLRGLEVERVLPYPIYAKTAFVVAVRLRNRSAWFGARYVALAQSFVDGPWREDWTFGAARQVPRKGGVGVELPTWFSVRGRKELGELELHSTHPFGLFRCRRRLEMGATCLAFPRLRRVPARVLAALPDPDHAAAVPARSGWGEEEFAGLREYRRGDNPRWIHWRSSARLDGRLLVREFERRAAKRACLVLEARLPEASLWGRRQFELGLELAASLAYELVKREFTLEILVRRNKTSRLVVTPGNRSLYTFFRLLALLVPEEDRGEEPLPLTTHPLVHIDPGRARRGEDIWRQTRWRA